MRKRRLPLVSPNWTPLTEVHRFLCEQTDNRIFAAQDLTDAMANDRVRSMRRQVYRPLGRLHDYEPRELLPPSFWATKYLLSSSATELQLVERRGHRLPLPPPRNSVVPGPNVGSIPISSSGYVFYAWKPDWRKIWVADVASTKARPPVQEVSVERGRKKVYDRPALTVIAFALFERRRQGEPEKTQAAVARELRTWCKEQKEKVPGNTTLNDIASAAFHVRKKWKASLKR